MSFLDHYIKHDLGFKYYGRYVDDFFVIHYDKETLKNAKKKIEVFLYDNLHLEINDKKVYLQSVFKGIRFLGVDIKPEHINMSKRVISNFDRAIESINKNTDTHKLSQSEIKRAISVMNSYLGITSHYDTYNLKKSMIFKIDDHFMRDITLSGKLEKINKRK